MPSTSPDATSGPRAEPSRRSRGSTAAAWLNVNGILRLPLCRSVSSAAPSMRDLRRGSRSATAGTPDAVLVPNR
ncbi:hypothetical protein GCM10023329_39070 [Streptomyces sanyensis]|uniref:Uncharacterized protein n=1 Tax=Streptomyces sanyensis TaxID=568869 RepID=A0ABP9ARP1_9ACTN